VGLGGDHRAGAGVLDAGGVDSDAIASPEKAAVQTLTRQALANDSLYPTLALLVFPYIDRAAHLVVGSDTIARGE